MRILLLEDHGESRNVIANLLGHCGYTVSAAGSLAEATALLETDSFDVLLSDIGLLDGDAFDLVKTARARPALELIVALTGRIADEVLAHRGVYFHTWFFLLRAAIYFAVWWFCAYQLNRWSVQQDEGKVAQTEADTRRFRVISAPGLLIYVVFISLASIDWLMSLDAHWFSTMFGFVNVFDANGNLLRRVVTRGP